MGPHEEPLLPDAAATPPAALVAVVIPALNEAGKIGRVLDKMPRDGRFDAIVVDDGSTDGTGDEARAHGAALELGYPYLALASGDDQHEPAELSGALDTLLATQVDYLQGSRWMPGGTVEGPIGNRANGTRFYSLVFSVLALRRVTDATNGFRLFRAELLRDPKINIDQDWLTSYDLEPYVLYKAIRRGYRVRDYPCTVRYHAREGYTKMRGIRDWWRLFRPAVLLRAGVKR